MDFSHDHLQRYLTHKLGEGTELRHVERFSRGTSRQTWFVTLRRPGAAEEEELIFRTDLAAGSIEPTSLDQEYFMYDRLGKANLPVARALWWEDDSSWTDMPFYVRVKIDGNWNIPHFLDPDPRYDPIRIEASKEHMRKLAMVHRVDWRGLGFGERLPVPKDEADCGRLYVENAIKQFEEIRVQPMPLFLEITEWLKDKAPVAPVIALCKGTNGFGEEVWRDGEIVALSDWEEASIGDPAADFAFMQYLAPELERDGKKIWGMEQALAYYREVSGIPVTLESVQFYGVIRALRLIIMGEKCAESIHKDAEHAEIRQGWTGTEIGFVCRQGVLAAMGLAEPPTSRWLAEFHESIEAPL